MLTWLGITSTFIIEPN